MSYPSIALTGILKTVNRAPLVERAIINEKIFHFPISQKQQERRINKQGTENESPVTSLHQLFKQRLMFGTAIDVSHVTCVHAKVSLGERSDHQDVVVYNDVVPCCQTLAVPAPTVRQFRFTCCIATQDCGTSCWAGEVRRALFLY